MSNLIPPAPSDLPSPKRLRVYTAAAVLTAVVLLVVVVLPAERGIDPTGLGRLAGFTEMGEIKVELAKEMAEDEAALALARLADSADVAESTAMVRDSAAAPGTLPAGAFSGRADIEKIAIPASGTAELLLDMKKDARVRYSWSTGGAVLDYAIQGDPVTSTSAHFYSRGFGIHSKVGVIVAAFDGHHGWYWRNTTDSVVTVTLQTSGDYKR